MKKLLILAAFLGILAPAFAYAATTVGTDIDTGGTLTVSGTTRIGPAESTLPAVLQGYASGGQLLLTSTDPFAIGVESTAGLGFFAGSVPDAANDNGEGLEWDILAGKNGQNISSIGAFGSANGFTGVTGHGFYVYTPNGSGGSMASYESFYSQDLGDASIDNPYYSWYDSRGVQRCKEDNTFNSVGQAICVVYNPQFTKYTAGASNYERIVFGQWSSNTAQIGPEAGGTGTLRPLQLLGNGVGIGVSNPTSQLQVATSSSNATTTVTLGKTGQNKGTCLEMYDAAGTIKYLSIQGGSLVVSATSCR